MDLDQNGTDSTRCLKYWLDPDNQGPLHLDGLEVTPPVPPPVTSSSVKIYFANIHENVSNVYVNDILKFDFSGTWPSSFNLTLYDIMGKIVLDRQLQKTGDKMEYQVSDIPSGIYIVRVKTPDQVVKRKIIKQNHINN